jgi:hypothetical protein
MISLQGSLKNCKVDTAWTERLQSSRFEDPDNMVCIPWNGRDAVGRTIGLDDVDGLIIDDDVNESERLVEPNEKLMTEPDIDSEIESDVNWPLSFKSKVLLKV